MRRELKSAEHGGFSRARHYVQEARQQAAHRFDFRHVAQRRVLAAEIIQPQGARRAPAAWAELLHHEPFRRHLPANSSDQLPQNVLHRHNARRAAEFIEHNRQAPLLPLQAFEQLQQIHGLRHKRRKLDRIRQINLRVHQQRPRVQDADDRIRRSVVNRQSAVLVLARRGNHFLEGQIIRNGRHLRARLHHFAGRAPVQADDLQDDLLFRLSQRPLLKRHLQQLPVIGVRQCAGGRQCPGHNGFKNGLIELLRHPAQRQAHAHHPGQRSHHAQGPLFRPAHRQSLGPHLAADQDQQQQAGDGQGERPVPVDGHP